MILLKSRHYNIEDCTLIQEALEEHGYYANIFICRELWNDYSSKYAAAWLTVPKDKAIIFSNIKPSFNNYIQEQL